MGIGSLSIRGSTCIRRFMTEERGSLTVFSLFMFILMLMMSGIAVDMMRYENTRTIAQNCMDRGVLAAANLEQSMDALDVTTDFLKKCGLDESLFTVDVDEDRIGDDLVGRKVLASVDMSLNTFFMHMVGIDQLPIASASAAEERVSEIEISMVLDVSGSMGSNNKLANMQDAAKDFVDIIFDQALEDRVSMSMVPYSTQVNIGPELYSVLNTTTDHDSSHCVDFDSGDYDATGIDPRKDNLQQAGHFDPWTAYDRGPAPRAFVCRTDTAFEVTPWSDDIDALKRQIDGFTASGNTSIDIAMKWGTALLDPQMAPALDALSSAGIVEDHFVGRPAAFDHESAKKFIVVMTDGINTTQYELKDAYRRGGSDTWYDPDTRRYSLPIQERGDADGDGRRREDWWYARTWGDGDYGRRWIDEAYDRGDDGDDAFAGPFDRVKEDDAAFELSWPQLFAQMTLSHRAFSHFYQQYGNADDYYRELRVPYTTVSDTEKDRRLNRICTAAKARGIVVFSVGFEVTDASAEVMRNCASSPSHFYRVDGLDISIAFASIANQINQLKLVQ